MRFGFIARRRGIWPVAWLCAALGVSRTRRKPAILVKQISSQKAAFVTIEAAS